MAFPVVQSSANGSSGSSTTSHSITLPSGITAGDLLLIFIGNDKYSGASPSASGWTYEGGQEIESPPTRNYPRLGVLSRIATGSEGSSVTVTTDVAKYASWIALRISGASGVQDIQSAILQTTTNPDPPSSGTVTTADSLAIAVSMSNDETATVSSYPSGYSSNQIYEASGDTSGIAMAMATKQFTGTTEDPGTYTFSASADTSSITLVLTTSVAADVLTADYRSFGLTGNDAAFAVDIPIPADYGSFDLTGSDAVLVENLVMPAELATFDLSGQDVGIDVALGITADSGSFSLTGNDIVFNVDISLAVDSGDFALSGSDASLSEAFTISAESATFNLTGTDSALSANVEMIAESGSFALTGNDAGTTVDSPMASDLGSFSLTGNDASFSVAGFAPLTADYGAFTLAGQSASLEAAGNYSMAADQSSFALTGNDAALSVAGAYSMTGEVGYFSFTGNSATLTGTDPCTFGVMFVGGIPLFVGGSPALSTCCCCDNPCPCCYYAVTLTRPIGDTWLRRLINPVGCELQADGNGYGFHCGDETYLTTKDTTPEVCVCEWDLSSDENGYDTRPCYQQSYTDSSQTDCPTGVNCCTYNPPGPGTGQEYHVGTMGFREVISVTMCYDPCGTIDVHITHRVYCNFGVTIFDSPPPIVGPASESWVDISTEEIAYSEYHWEGVTCPNCEELPDLGAPTSETLASPFTKNWGTAFLNCAMTSAFEVTFPGACSATGLTLIGGGTPCDC